MKIPAIKKLVENSSMGDLVAAEVAIIEEQELKLEVEGADEGEQLTHIMAAIFIKNYMDDNQADFKSSVREYTKKVRESIS